LHCVVNTCDIYFKSSLLPTFQITFCIDMDSEMDCVYDLTKAKVVWVVQMEMSVTKGRPTEHHFRSREADVEGKSCYTNLENGSTSSPGPEVGMYSLKP
jgi:hypothetical protein